MGTFIQADPTDDFSFSLSHGTDVEAYWLMSESRVADIFADRLDLFRTFVTIVMLTRALVE